jgi:hypothetical protein
MLISWMAWLRGGAARTGHLLAVIAGVGVAIAALACWTIPAEGEIGPASPADGETGPPSSSGGVSCPSPNPPNELTLMAGTPQTATLGSAFATNLEVAFTNSDGCPVTTAVAGIPVTFSAPSTGASGIFSASGSNAVTVGSDASGTVSAPVLTANNPAGSYTVTASSAYGSISFSLTNVDAGYQSACGTLASTTQSTGGGQAGPAEKPTKLTAGVGASQSTPAGTRFPIGLAVTVTDAEKDPVADVLVTFSAPNRGPSGYFTVRSGGAEMLVSGAPGSHAPRSHTSHPRRLEVRTDGCGVALAPAFTANRRDGGYVVVASVERLTTAFALVNEGR